MIFAEIILVILLFDLNDVAEDASHYLFQCRKVSVERQDFNDKVRGFQPLNINVILYGNTISNSKIWPISRLRMPQNAKTLLFTLYDSVLKRTR